MKVHKFQKLLAFVLALCLLAGMLPMSASAKSYPEPNGLKPGGKTGFYEICGQQFPYAENAEGGTVTLYQRRGETGINTSAVTGAVTVPDEIDGMPVTRLEQTFMGCENLESVILPESLKILGSVTEPEKTFYDQDKAEAAGGTAASGYVFLNCSSLKSITLPDGLTTIGTYAFRGCRALGSLAIPANVTSIGEAAFHTGSYSGTGKNLNLTIAPGNTSYVIENGALYDREKTLLLSYATTKWIPSFTVAPGVKKIGEDAFGYAAVSSVILPQGLEKIGAGAFEDSMITSITIPDSVSWMGEGVFQYCTSLQTVTLPSSLHNLPARTFENTQLASVDIPAGVTEIAYNAFSSCDSLKSVKLPDTLTSIGSSAFRGCSSLETADLPTALTSLGDAAFAKCSSLKSVEIPDGVENLNESSFPYSGCTGIESFSVGGNNPNYAEANGALTSKDKTEILKYMLGNTDSFEVPAAVTSISSYAFDDCTNLQAFTAASGNTSFSAINGVLYNQDGTVLIKCPPKKEGVLDIAANVTDIREDFTQCSLLTGFTVDENNATYFSQDEILYEDTNVIRLIRCPAGKEGAVVIPDDVLIWKPMSFSGCSKITSLTFPASFQVFSKEGWGEGTHPANVLKTCSSLTMITIAENNRDSKSVDGAVYNKSGTALWFCPPGKTKFTIADGTDTVDYSAFSGSTNMEYIVFPASVTNAGGPVAGWSGSKNVIIYGELGSTAENYAKQYFYTFRPGTPEDYKVVPNWDAVKVKTSAVFGTVNKYLVTLPSSGTATDGTTTVSGTYSVQDGDVMQDAGSQNVTVQFTVTTAGDYKGMTFTKDYPVTITKRPVAVTMENKTRKYGETNPKLTYKVTGGISPAGSSDDNLTVTPACTAAKSSPAGTPVEITATAVSDNYAVTIAPGKLTITKADITGIATTAPTGTILANDSRNTDSTALKAAISLPSTVSVSYKDGTESLPIVWGNAEEKFSAKGGAYTYQGKVTSGTNFNAYTKTLTATLTVTPVTGTVSQVNGQAATALSPVTVAKSAAQNAASYEELGLPASIQLTFDNGVASQTFSNLTYSVPLATLKNKGVNSTTEVTITSIPVWVTIPQGAVTTQVKITDKFPVNVNITQTGWIYGAVPADPVVSQTDAGNGTEAHAAWSYLYTGTTAGGKTYRSEEKPIEAGSYTVTATLVSDTYAGSGTANFIIDPLVVQDSMITVMGPVTYNGKAQTPIVTVTNGQTVLKPDTDYTVDYADNVNAGSSAKVTVTGKGNYGSTASKTFTIAPMDISSAAISLEGSGTADGILLASVEGLPTPLPNNGFEWYVGGIKNSNSLCYQLLDTSHANQAVTVKAVGSGNYTGSTALSQEIAVEKQTIRGTVGIFETGDPRDGMVAVGDEIGAETGMVYPKGLMLTYQWLRNGSPIESAVSRTYTLQEADSGQSISVEVSAPAEYQGVLTSDTIVVGKTFISGILSITPNDALTQGQKLTVSEISGRQELTEGTDYVWQWYRNDVSIPGADSSEYTLTAADLGKRISANLIGQGEYEGTITCGISVPSVAPATPTLTPTAGNGKITLSMSEPENGVPCLYEIQLLDGQGNLIATKFTLNSSYSWDGLINGTRYQIKATAITTAGKSVVSEPVAVTPKSSSSGGGSQPVGPEEPEQPDNGPVSETVVSPDGTVTTTTTWPDGREAKAVKTPEGDKSILVTTPEGEKLADITIPSKPGEAKSFEDVKDGSWYKESVDTASSLGLFSGTGEKTFSPDQSLTRGMLVTTLYRLSGTPEYGTDSNAFPDIKDGAWYEEAANWANAAGIASGTGTGFEPNANITREQLVTMIYRYTQTIGAGSTQSGDITAFPDHGKVSDYAKEAMSWAVGEGLIQGKNGIIAPRSTATRAEVATVLSRLVDLLTK